jgi:HAD superfamily hydrolase (TIGR01484 family)
MMLPVAELAQRFADLPLGIFTDIDDTLTTGGYLSGAVYTALERLQAAGIAVVPVTGRPAGWCDMIARFWPVDGVVGENGAFYFRYDRAGRRMVRRYAVSAELRARYRETLRELAERIVSTVPGCAVASDQAYRESDLAIDFAEDVGPLPPEAVDAIVSAFVAAGATAKVSSIHVNGWFGTYDKSAMTRTFAHDVLHCDLERDNERFIFVGDSPNDAPMFAFFRNACGVGNVRDFGDRMPHLPRFVAEGHGGAGFLEIVDEILKAS